MVLETERLILRKLTEQDDAFILERLNEPSFLHYIGDRGVRTRKDARRYIRSGPVKSYKQNGFGLYLVVLKATGDPIGMCGLLKRETLEDVDIGFAFSPKFWLQGYAVESATAVMNYGREVLGLKRIVAITAPDNKGSIRVLERIGLRFERMVKMSDDEPPIRLYGVEL